MTQGLVTIGRWGHTPYGTFGSLEAVGLFAAYSLELPWNRNQRRISCIPCGTYPLRRSHYHQGDYPCWEICDVPDRDEIKIHIGNTIADILGCVVIGTGLGRLYKKWAVTSSGIAYQKWMEATSEWDAASIVIFNRTP